jgi:hypothetical protein
MAPSGSLGATAFAYGTGSCAKAADHPATVLRSIKSPRPQGPEADGTASFLRRHARLPRVDRDRFGEVRPGPDRCVRALGLPVHVVPEAPAASACSAILGSWILTRSTRRTSDCKW